MSTFRLDPMLGYVPAVPLPFYSWQFWKWQKVRCQCGATFVSRDLGLMPPEYETHYVLTHIKEAEA
jgi:hypothetical protein